MVNYYKKIQLISISKIYFRILQSFCLFFWKLSKDSVVSFLLYTLSQTGSPTIFLIIIFLKNIFAIVVSVPKPLTKIKNSVIGPLCKIGGEIDTVIIQSNTNKVHEGHLGDAFLGEWVNLGAGTINSNLKNNYESVKVHINYQSVDTGKIHVGCFIGDHVKTAIGTLINSGTVIGPGTMIATDGFFPKTIKPFTWFVKGKHHKVDFEKFIKTAEIVKNRRGQKLLDIEKQLLKKININCKSKK